MFRSTKMFSAILVVLLSHNVLSGASASAAENPAQAIAGVWRLTAYAREEVETGKKVDLFGQHPSGYLTFSPAGRFIGVLVGDNRKPPAEAVVTDPERIALYNSIIGAYSGSYTIEDDKIVIAVDVSWNQAWTGTKQIRYFKVTGKQLMIRNPPRKDPRDGKTITSTLIFEKVE
jgi:Lipocalin-like domain